MSSNAFGLDTANFECANCWLLTVDWQFPVIIQCSCVRVDGFGFLSDDLDISQWGCSQNWHMQFLRRLFEWKSNIKSIRVHQFDRNEPKLFFTRWLIIIFARLITLRTQFVRSEKLLYISLDTMIRYRIFRAHAIPIKQIANQLHSSESAKRHCYSIFFAGKILNCPATESERYEIHRWRRNGWSVNEQSVRSWRRWREICVSNGQSNRSRWTKSRRCMLIYRGNHRCQRQSTVVRSTG